MENLTSIDKTNIAVALKYFVENLQSEYLKESFSQTFEKIEKENFENEK